jgi:hypothetical protein
MSKLRLSIATASILLVCAAGYCAAQVGATQAAGTEAGASAATGAADAATLDALLSTIRSNRKALVAVNLHLTDEEAAAFWPVYDRYAGEINAVGDRLASVITAYVRSFPDVSDDEAMQLLDDYLKAEADRVAVRRSYVGEFAKTVPGRKLARLYQIENKMDAVIRYDLAATIPVVDEKTGAPPK